MYCVGYGTNGRGKADGKNYYLPKNSNRTSKIKMNPCYFTYLQGMMREISLEKFKEALMGRESELVVESFADFVEKFSPIIYETVVKTRRWISTIRL